MFYLTRRQTHAALAGVAAAATYLAAAEIGSKRPVKVGGLFMLSTLAMAGIVTAQASAKAYSAHQRIDALVPAVHNKYDKTGGTISGSVTVTGNHVTQGNSTAQNNHTVQGTLFGSGGTLQIGDNLGTPSGALQVNPQLTVLSGSGVHTNGPFIGNTTGDSHVTATQLTNTWATQVENRINDILNAIG